MSDTSIEWTSTVNPDGSITKGKTWNPTTGCTRVDAACIKCYAQRMAYRLMHIPATKARYEGTVKKTGFGDINWTGKINLIDEVLNYPLTLKKPCRIFVDSMSDLFHEDVPRTFIAKVYAIMFLAKQHTFLILTKRDKRRLEVFTSDIFYEYLWIYCNEYHNKYIKNTDGEAYHLYTKDEIRAQFPFKNVCEGVSVGEVNAKHRIETLRQTPASYRFISAEPIIEDLGVLNLSGINQIIVGGESGHGKRPFNTGWAKDILTQARQQGVAFYMKQVDKVRPIPDDLNIREY